MARRVDAVPGEPVERPVQGHGIGRGQRAVVRAVGRDHAERAEARAPASERGVDLAGEIRDRALAARARHGDDDFRLPRMERRGRPRQESPRVRDLQVGDVRRQVGRPGALAGHRDGAAPRRVRREGETVGPRAGHGHEQTAGHDGAAVGRDGPDGHGRRARHDLRERSERIDHDAVIASRRGQVQCGHGTRLGRAARVVLSSREKMGTTDGTGRAGTPQPTLAHARAAFSRKGRRTRTAVVLDPVTKTVPCGALLLPSREKVAWRSHDG